MTQKQSFNAWLRAMPKSEPVVTITVSPSLGAGFWMDLAHVAFATGKTLDEAFLALLEIDEAQNGIKEALCELKNEVDK